LADHVTVIIPAFNAVRYLAEAVASVQRQRHDPLDIIVVDDGSTDGTPELAAQLPGIRCIRQHHGGPAFARNAGIQEAQGEFLAFLDADDLWSENKLAAQLAVLRETPQVDLVAGQVEEFYEAGVSPIEARRRRHSGDRAYTIGALLVRRDVFLKVGLLNSALRFGEFMDWRSRARARGLKEQVLDMVVLRRRVHDHNTTRLAQDFRSDYLAMIRAHLQRQRPAASAAPKPEGSP
jgi:glycosyltransferase involved in cell wall biosynthesis